MVAFQDVEWLWRCDVAKRLFGFLCNRVVDLVEMSPNVRLRLALNKTVVAAILPGNGVECKVIGDVWALSSRLSQSRVVF